MFLFFSILVSYSFTPQEVALQAEKKLLSIQSLQAHFEQTYYSSSISTPLKEKGDLYFKKPNWMKWEYKDPEPKIYLLKEDLFFEYIPEENQITKYDLSKEGYESEILSILSGQKGLIDNHMIEFNPFLPKNKEAWQLKLTPLEEDDEYAYFLLEINKKTWLIQKAIFFDWGGNKSEFQFSKIKTNIRLPVDVFELKVPPNVEIIGEVNYKSKYNRDDQHNHTF